MATTVLGWKQRERLYALLDVRGKVSFALSGLGRIELLEQMTLDATEDAFHYIRQAYLASHPSS